MDLLNSPSATVPAGEAPGGSATESGVAGSGAQQPAPPAVADAISRIAEKHGAGGGNPEKEKRGPGRPPTHGRYSQAAGSNGKNPVRTAPVEGGEAVDAGKPRPSLPPALLGRIAKAGTAVVEQLGTNLVKAKAIAAGISEAEARPVIESTKLAPELKELVADLTPEALKEWGMDPSVSPTGALVGIFGVWGVGIFSALQTFEAERKRKEETKSPAANIVPLPAV